MLHFKLTREFFPTDFGKTELKGEYSRRPSGNFYFSLEIVKNRSFFREEQFSRENIFKKKRYDFKNLVRGHLENGKVERSSGKMKRDGNEATNVFTNKRKS